MQYGVYDQVNSQFVFDVRRHQRIDWQRSHCDGMRKIFSKFLSVTASTNIKDIGEQELCNPYLLRKYANYLVNHFVTGDDERLMCDSAKQYLSGVFNVIKLRFPSNPNYTAAGSEWYKKLRKDLKSQITLRCFELGEELASKSFPIGWDILKDIT